MAWQSGYGGSMHFGGEPGSGTGVDWADMLLGTTYSITRWRVRTGFQMHEVPYIGMTDDGSFGHVTPPLVNGFSRWTAQVGFLIPIEFTTDSMIIRGASIEWTPVFYVNATDRWSAKAHLVSLETDCPLDGPTRGVAVLRGIRPMAIYLTN